MMFAATNAAVHKALGVFQKKKKSVLLICSVISLKSLN